MAILSVSLADFQSSFKLHFRMKKITKLRICDWSLLIITVAILISGIQMEASGSDGSLPVWIHIVIGLLFMSICAWHIYLHYGTSNWFTKFHNQKKQYTRVLWWVGLLAFASAIAATIHWLSTTVHSPIGGVHGKIGFLMIAILVGHIYKRVKFYRLK